MDFLASVTDRLSRGVIIRFRSVLLQQFRNGLFVLYWNGYRSLAKKRKSCLCLNHQRRVHVSPPVVRFNFLPFQEAPVLPDSIFGDL